MTVARKTPIPVTILSGFLGAGKTTLLERILTQQHGLKVAVIINDMSQVNVDAALVQQHKVSNQEEKLIQLQNGCICCTLRGDLLEELVNLSEQGAFDYIVIESTGIAEPMQVAETFSTDFSQTLLDTPGVIPEAEEALLRKVVGLGGLEKVAKIDTCVTVVDAANFLANIETTEFLAQRFGDSGQNEAERTVTNLMVDQIEFADVIIINKVSRVKKRDLAKIGKMIQGLNPVARTLHADYCKVPLKEIINTGLYDFEKASSSAGWLQSIHEMTLREGYGDKSKSVLAPKPETEEYGVNSFVYNSRRPFHPERLYLLLKDKFFIIEEAPQALDDDEELDGEEDEDEQEQPSEDEDDEDGGDELSEQQLLTNKKASPFGPLLRSKGFFWLATRQIMRGEWSSAGLMLTLKGGIPWFQVSGLDGIPEETATIIRQEFEGPYGDRRNEIVFIGLGIDTEALTRALDQCLLTDAEFHQFERITKQEANLLKAERKLANVFDDGFEDWILIDDDDLDSDHEQDL